MQGHKFRRQVPIGGYIADFVCHEARLIVKIDVRNTIAHRRGKPSEGGPCLANLDGVHETMPASWAASPPPKPSPLKGEGFCQV